MKSVKIDADDDHVETNSQTFDNLKNRKKVDLLQGIDLSKYDEKMIRLLLDGDYRGELKQYKNKVMMLVHEIIDKRIPHTKFGVNTLLYKLVRDVRNDRNASANIKERQPRTAKPPSPTATEDDESQSESQSENNTTESEPEEEEEEEMEEVDEKTFKRELLKMAKTDKQRALQVLAYNLKPTSELYRTLVAKIKKI